MPRRPKSQRWLKMGVEMEGGWNTSPHDLVRGVSGAQVKEDGSVRISGVNYVNEVTTKAHIFLSDLLEDIKTLHPVHANESCGYHIHASFEIPDYMTLMDPAFWSYYLERWDAWYTKNSGLMTRDEATRFMQRFSGRGRDSGTNFCKREFIPAKQIGDGSSGGSSMRYTQLNFSAYHRHKTLECRMLPMFTNSAVTQLATAELADIYDTFLSEFDTDSKFFEEDMDFELEGEEGYITTAQTLTFQSADGWEEDLGVREVAPRLPPPGEGQVFYRFPGVQFRFPDEEREESL